MGKPNVRRRSRVAVGRSLWLVVLVPILAVSAYSLFFVARYLGVPPFVAVCFSACFDGVALLSAEYSLKYAQEGLSGSFPRTVVRVMAGVAAYVQTLHAQIGHELPGSWVIWASLPISAVTIYEVHLRYERRKALAAAGVTFAAPLPAFGFATWVLFPLASLTSLERIVRRRKEAIEDMAYERPALTEVVVPKEDVPKAVAPKDGVTDITTARKKHAPSRHIRTWARAQPQWAGKIGDRARLPQAVIDDYNREHATGG